MTDDTLIRRLYVELGARVRTRRAALDMRQEDLARAARISRASVANIERGRQQPPVHVLLALADALGLEMGALLPTRAELDAHLAAPHKVPKLVNIGGESSLMSAQIGELVAQLLTGAASFLAAATPLGSAATGPGSSKAPQAGMISPGSRTRTGGK